MYMFVSKDTMFVNHSGTLVVNAEGKVQVVPDTVTINAGIEILGAENQEEAYQKMNTSIAAVQSILWQEKIDVKHIQTSDLSVSEDFYWGEGGRKSQGYRANQSLIIRIENREVSVANTILDALSGVPHINIHGVSYDLADKEEVYREARKLAVEKARTKAEEMASAAGIKLVSVAMIEEEFQNHYPVMMAQNAKMMDLANSNTEEAGTHLSIGQLDYTATVKISYRVQ